MSEPLYQVIINDLSQLINTQQLKPGDRLPTESDLSKQYQVSRITAKRALDDLERAGMIYRKRGAGSFVAKPVTTNNPQNTIHQIYLIFEKRQDQELQFELTLRQALQETKNCQYYRVLSFDLKQANQLDLGSLQPATDQVLVLGHLSSENLIYQIQLKDISLYHIIPFANASSQTIPPTMQLNTQAFTQLLLSWVTSTNVFYQQPSASAGLTDLSFVPSIINQLKTTQPKLLQHFHFTTAQSPTINFDSELDSQTKIIFTNFYDLINFQATHSKIDIDLEPVLYTTFLTAQQMAYLRTNQITSYYFPLAPIIKAVLEILTQKNDVNDLPIIDIMKLS
ncbi:GntR family transcriptional regulator [Lactobacillus sp. CC-MHH1034]|uniref:GntR family transcriptional regulator n=1 Tax=Agrilactobacillus fermenti TaxID=2586909 RepID=UPI001E41B50D|nr:GntR family transcriptional regulator [Agrilactobacillus fermenti]MCD2255231.1 GntR family transcriptional regulator [Agrilactobacillus fermenti]